MILPKEFYYDDGRVVAKKLLGKTLVRIIEGVEIRTKIVETEAYIGAIDKASHAYNGRRTERTEPLFHDGGIAYVYFIYGLYHCFNIISDRKDYASGVLIRAVEPLNEFDYIARKRFNLPYDKLSKSQVKSLTNGPSKLCMALDITKKDNFKKLYEKGDLYVEDGENEDLKIVESKRIGIDYAEEAKDFLWRYYIDKNIFVSKK